LGLVIVTISLIVLYFVGYQYFKGQEDTIRNEQKDYYRYEYKKQMTETLFRLYQDLEKVFKQYNLKEALLTVM
jgi:hypothetical protein